MADCAINLGALWLPAADKYRAVPKPQKPNISKPTPTTEHKSKASHRSKHRNEQHRWIWYFFRKSWGLPLQFFGIERSSGLGSNPVSCPVLYRIQWTVCVFVHAGRARTCGSAQRGIMSQHGGITVRAGGGFWGWLGRDSVGKGGECIGNHHIWESIRWRATVGH